MTDAEHEMSDEEFEQALDDLAERATKAMFAKARKRRERERAAALDEFETWIAELERPSDHNGDS